SRAGEPEISSFRSGSAQVNREPVQLSLRRRHGFIKRFTKQKAPLGSLMFLLVLTLLSVGGYQLGMLDGGTIDIDASFAGPSLEHPLGNDDLGRDFLARVLAGCRLSLLTAGFSVLIGSVAGVVPGLVAGYRGGGFDYVAGRIADALMTIPGLVLSVSLVAALGPGVTQVAIAIGVAFAPRFFRIARASAMAVAPLTYMRALEATGARQSRLLLRHVLPNAFPAIVVQGSLMFGYGVLAEASLSYLGFGAQPPDASLGTLLQRGTQFMTESAYLTVMPGIVIVAIVLAANTVGDGIQSALGREALGRAVGK
ncbi:MAG: ABC transporter permease, partial [Actinomycetota bacterium]|nr:ABC transporter permease [Actinomycetota bacterium]